MARSKVYRVPVTIQATMYIKATSKDAAAVLALRYADTVLDLECSYNGDAPPISGADYDDPELPKVSISPAMTLEMPKVDQIETAD